MWDKIFKLAGTVNIPGTKRAELNGYVLQILDKCGIRKMEKMKLDGKTITVVKMPKPDESGILSFDYSIFEKKKRENATYNMNSCELLVPDSGDREFAMAMNTISVLLEAYSETNCYLMCENKPAYISRYAAIVKTLLGIELSFPHRERMWDMLLFLKNTEEYKEITGEDVWDSFPFPFGKFIAEHAITILEIDAETIDIPRELFTGKKSEIKNAPKESIKYYVFQMMKQLIDKKEDEKLETFLKKLLDADIQERQKAAAGDNEYGIIAEASLYLLPAMIVQAFAYAQKREFWRVWHSMGIKGYSEVKNMKVF